MNPLPQRKKSAGEIAKLRESLGIPGAVPPAAPPVPPEASTGEPQATAADPSTGDLKPVRSLRKSERLPAPEKRPAPADGEAKLPTRRRTDRELNELRRRAAMQTRPPIAHLQSITAHPLLLGLGYVLALAGGVGGLLIAAYIFRKKPRSTHHAGFMVTLAVFAIVSGVLYFFPQLRHAS